MSEFSLPAPWGASESQLDCARCGKVTNHYERRVTVMADEASDRRAGHVAWFCTECGTRQESRSDPGPPLQSGDDLTELFDRH
jgi:hypothetical protein